MAPRRPATIDPGPAPERLPPVEHPGQFVARKASNARSIRLEHRLRLPANRLDQHPVGLAGIDDGIWPIYLCHVLLVMVNERDRVVRG